MRLDYARIRFGEEASSKLSLLKGRTGLTPNLLARIGFCLSLKDPTVPTFEDYLPESDREIERQTLTGKWDALFLALFTERCFVDQIPEDDQLASFKAHMNRGVLLLEKRIKKFNDLAVILPKAFQADALRDDMELALGD